MCERCRVIYIRMTTVITGGYLVHKCPRCGIYVKKGFSLLQVRLNVEQRKNNGIELLVA